MAGPRVHRGSPNGGFAKFGKPAKPATHASIYAFLDHLGQIRYVGKAVRPHRRAVGHHQRGRRHMLLCIGMRRTCRCSYLARWLGRDEHYGKPVSFLILEIVPFAQWANAERRWIAYARAHDQPLTNIAAGGPMEPRKSRRLSRKSSLLSPLSRPIARLKP